MLHRFRDRFGTAGLVVAIVALVLALGGTALAAKGALTGKQKKEVEKIAKKYAGKPGAPGATGPAGPAGAAGAKGDTGAKGDKGEKGDTGNPGTPGTPGTPGADGKSVESIPIATGEASCEGNGGTVLEVEESGEPQEICNGSPWTVGSLPNGKTETGMWAVGHETAETAALAPVSFAVPLASTTGMSVHFINVAGEEEKFSEAIGPKPAECSGTGVSPTAAPGNLCVYESSRSGPYESGEGMSFEQAQGGVKVTGSILNFFSEPGGFAYGSFAVTAPTS